MIIAFYPGAGGNRYLQRILDCDWSQPNRSYDLKNTDQQFKHRYLLDCVPSFDSQHILTHCMNSKKIQELFPGQPVVFIKSDLQTSLQREWALHGHERFLNQAVKIQASRLEHYNAFKDLSWPVIASEDQLDHLPSIILQEINDDYVKVINPENNVPGVLAQLTQHTLNKINSAYEIIMWHLNYYKTYPVDFSCANQIIDVSDGDDEFSLLMQKELNRYQSEIFKQVWDAVNE